jgi:hypothetical protein
MKICIVVNSSFVFEMWLIYILGEINYEVLSVITFFILRITVSVTCCFGNIYWVEKSKRVKYHTTHILISFPFLVNFLLNHIASSQ